ncbi:MAG TPA: HK97 family phage prohead protease [Armatimonadota bacterium]|nr:HK97 family phage prohead protease [Armatimonadota bacterium]
MIYKSFTFKAAPVEGLGENEFAGYASVFGNVDDYGDIVQRGAFAASLPFFLKDGMICWQHRLGVPIGKPVEAYEDEKGLFVRGRISDTAAGRDCLTLMRDGVVQKLSIGYETEGYQVLSEEQARVLLGDAGYEAALKALPWWADELRLLTQIKLYEVSPVSFPANDAAEILGVKSAGGRLPETEREFERFLRDAGWPRKAAVALTGHGFKGLQRDAGQDLDRLAASLKQAAATLRA